MSDFSVRDNSYSVRLQRGDRVILTADTYSGGPLTRGTRGTVVLESNAGFRGIEASVKFDDGRTAHGISTGLLRKL